MFDVLNVKQLGINFRVMEKQGKKDVKNSVLHRRPYEWRFYFLPPPLQYLCFGEWGKLYRVSQEECARLRESVPYVELYQYNPKHLYPKLNGYGDNGHRKVWASGVSTSCTPSVTPYSTLRMPGNETPLANIVMQ